MILENIESGLFGGKRILLLEKVVIMAHWKVLKNGYKIYVRSPEETLKRMQDQEARRQQRYQEEQRAVSQAMLEELRGIRQGLESQPAEAPQQKREYGYWPDSLKRLLQILEKSGRAIDFMARAKSGANMLELLHEHGLATIAERDSKSTQRAVCKALEKFRDYVNAYAQTHQDDYRADIEQLDDIAHGAGLTDARRKSGKPHDYTPKFKEPKKK